MTELDIYLKSLYDDPDHKDLKLIIKDDENTITLDVHKAILGKSSKYFKTACNKDKTMTHYEMQVRNAEICCYIIKSFYHIEHVIIMNEWHKTCELLLCQDYLSLPVKKEMLYFIKVPEILCCNATSNQRNTLSSISMDESPEEGFVLLLNVISSLNLWDDKQIIKMIRFNIPSNYIKDNNWKFAEKILAYKPRYVVIKNFFNCSHLNYKYTELFVVDIDTNEQININTDKIDRNYSLCERFTFSTCRRYIMMCLTDYRRISNEYKIVQYDLLTCTHKYIYNCTRFNVSQVKSLYYINDDINLVLSGDKKIIILDLETYIDQMCIDSLPDENELVITSTNYYDNIDKKRILDLCQSGKLDIVKKMNFDWEYTRCKLSKDNLVCVLLAPNSNIYVFDVINDKILLNLVFVYCRDEFSIELSF
jgi:BTB/POZ domain